MSEYWHKLAAAMVAGDQRISTLLFRMQVLTSILEDELYDFCVGIGMDGHQWHRSFVDDYDSSIEFTECADDMRLTPAQQKALWDEGFLRCWLNHTDGSETYYYRDDPATEGHRKRAPSQPADPPRGE